MDISLNDKVPFQFDETQWAYVMDMMRDRVVVNTMIKVIGITPTNSLIFEVLF